MHALCYFLVTCVFIEPFYCCFLGSMSRLLCSTFIYKRLEARGSYIIHFEIKGEQKQPLAKLDVCCFYNLSTPSLFSPSG